MASSPQLRSYLAHWFQLGKPVQVQTTGERLCPTPVMVHGSYSSAFEDCWQQLQQRGLAHCHLEGTEETLAELLTDQWDLAGCARCGMPTAQRVRGITPASCPCTDLPTWPNTELPAPRGERDWRSQLQNLNRRVSQAGARSPRP